MTRFLDLPLEILYRISAFADVSDLKSLSLAHPHLDDLVTASPALQFRFAAHSATVEANQFTGHVPAERLSALELLEQGWSKLDIDFRRTIPVQHQTSGLYDLTAGACVLGDVDRRTLYYCRLPQKPSDEVKWSNIPVGHEMVDFGLAIYEHDLIAVLTLSPHAQYVDCCMVELRLLQFSTGNLHPLAQTPVLFVEALNWSHPAILIEIVGDHLVLIMTHFQVLLSDRLFVYQWKTGTLKLAAYLPFQTYHGVIFLSPTILSLPNKRMNTLDIWLIPDTPLIRQEPLAPLKPFLSIGLPKLSPTHSLLTSLCRAEPNPTPSGTPHSSQPFQPIPEDSIVIFSLRGIRRSTMRQDTFTMFVHRSSLLNMILVKNPDHSADAILGHRTILLPWEQWGMKVTRIFKATAMSLAWITTTAGQRCAVDLTQSLEEDEDDEDDEEREQTLTVLDFNPRTVQRLYKESMDTDEPSRIHLDESVVEHEMFEEPVKTSLPYVSRVLSLKNDSNVPFKGVLLDEERILGIKLNDEDLITEIEVMHIGRLDSPQGQKVPHQESFDTSTATIPQFLLGNRKLQGAVGGCEDDI